MQTMQTFDKKYIVTELAPNGDLMTYILTEQGLMDVPYPCQ